MSADTGVAAKPEPRISERLLKRLDGMIDGLMKELADVENFRNRLIPSELAAKKEDTKLITGSGIFAEELAIRIDRLEMVYGKLLSVNKKLSEF